MMRAAMSAASFHCVSRWRVPTVLVPAPLRTRSRDRRFRCRPRHRRSPGFVSRPIGVGRWRVREPVGDVTGQLSAVSSARSRWVSKRQWGEAVAGWPRHLRSTQGQPRVGRDARDGGEGRQEGMTRRPSANTGPREGQRGAIARASVIRARRSGAGMERGDRSQCTPQCGVVNRPLQGREKGQEGSRNCRELSGRTGR